MTKDDAVKKLRLSIAVMTEELERQRLELRNDFLPIPELKLNYEVLSSFAIDVEEKGLWETFIESTSSNSRDEALRILLVRFGMEEALMRQSRLLEDLENA